MKKLFTTILMMGIALFSWGQDNPSLSGTELTVTIGANESFSTFWDALDKNPSWKGNVTKLILTGEGFTNADFVMGGKVVDLVKLCCGDNGTIYLDMEGCSGVVSKVKYIGDGDKDYTSKKFVYDYLLKTTVNVEQKDVYVTENGQTLPSYVDTSSFTGEGPWTWDGWDGVNYTSHTVTKTTAWGYTENNNFVIVPDEKVNLATSTADIEKELPAFNFGQNQGDLKDYLKGITFPNSSNFTAIPTGICSQEKCPNLEDIVISFKSESNDKTDYIEWIGYQAFMGKESANASERSKLNNVTFPSSLKVICTDAFFACTNFTEVDLDLPNLVRVDAAAFNMKNTEWNNLTTVYLPGNKSNTDNNSLRFFANQVFSSSHITTLDFSHCLGIRNFAYDGKDTMGEDDYTPQDEEKFGGTATFTWYVDLKTLILPPDLRYVPGGDKGFAPDCPKLETVTFTGSAVYENCEITNPLVIGENAFSFNQEDQTENVVIVGDVKLRLINKVTLSNNITLISEKAFANNNLKDVHIPASVEEIKNGAFDLCCNLEKVYFDEIDSKYKGCNHAATIIRGTGTASGGAFANCRSLTDVYVNTKTLLTCENGAFTKDITVGQTDINMHKATLHFPDGEDYVNHYVNMNHLLDEETANDAGALQAWLNAHWDEAQGTSEGYGWYEFVSSGPSDITVSGDAKVILRTFSDYNYARLVPNGLRAYIVTNVEKNTNNQYEITLKRLNVIPRQTGVILYGQPNSEDETGVSALTLTPVNYEGKPLTRARWESGSETYDSSYDTNYINYLEPCLTEDGSEVTVYPYEPYRSGKTVEWRNFGLSKFNETKTLHTKSPLGENESDFYSFFRLLKGDYTSGYAYLHMRASEFEDAEGAECIIIKDDNYSVEYTTQSTSGSSSEEPSITGVNYDQLTNLSDNPLQYWQFAKWDVIGKGFGYRPNRWNETHFVQYLGEMEDCADGIEQLSVSTNDSNADCYTLQGVKVSNPSKGVYIKNGKKMIIK